MTCYARPPGASFERCALTHVERRPIDLDRALEQHAAFVRTLRELGREVVVLPALDDLPDACFLEDPALILGEVAVITRPALAERRRESASLEALLAPHHTLVRITAPATLEGGDVLVQDDTLYVGWSGRTNHAGLKQLAHRLLEHGYRVKAAGVKGCLHLKTAACSIGPNRLLVNPRWVDLHRVREMEILEVDPREPFAAFVLRVGERVVASDAYPRTRERLERAGIEVVSLDLSEFHKAEAGPTCLVLRDALEGPASSQDT